MTDIIKTDLIAILEEFADGTGTVGDDIFKPVTSGDATIDGLDGTDTVDYSGLTRGKKLVVKLDEGFAKVRKNEGGRNKDTFANVENIIGNSKGKNKITGDDGDNAIVGGEKKDKLDGAGGNDVIAAGAGNNKIFGGTGADTVIISGGGKNKVDLGADSDVDTIQIKDSFKKLIVKEFGAEDTFDLSALGLEITTLEELGNLDNVTIKAKGGGKHTLIKIVNTDGSKSKVLLKKTSLDSLSDANFVFVPGGGTGDPGDPGDPGDGILNPETGELDFIGTAERDTIIQSDPEDETVSLIDSKEGDDFVLSEGGHARFLGGAGDDTFVDFGDTLSGGDILEGGEGADTFFLHVGNDGTQAATSLGADVIKDFNPLEGDMVIVQVTGFPTFSANDEGDLVVKSLRFGREQIVLTFENFPEAPILADSIIFAQGKTDHAGTAENDFLEDEIGTDDLFLAGAGADDIFADRGDDIVSAGSGDDTVFAGDGNDRVFGQAGDDILEGGTGIDQLNGGKGDDTINGGTRGDFLQGGEGFDIFVFDNLTFGNDPIAAHDSIVDFEDGVDLIRLEGFGITSDTFDDRVLFRN